MTGRGLRFGDLLGLAGSGLWRQKGRTALSLAGIAVGTFAFAASLSVGIGIDRAIVGLFRGTKALRQVSVQVRYEPDPEEVPKTAAEVEGSFATETRERLARALARREGNSGPILPRRKLDAEGLDALQALSGVAEVRPIVRLYTTATLGESGPGRDALCVSVDPEGDYRGRVVAGRPLQPGESGSVVIHELLLYESGLRGEAEFAEVLGKSIHLDVRRHVDPRDSMIRMLGYAPFELDSEEAETLLGAAGRLARLIDRIPWLLPRGERSAVLKLLTRLSGTADVEAASPEVGLESIGGHYRIVGVIRERLGTDPEPLGSFGDWEVRDADILLATPDALTLHNLVPEFREAGVNQAVVTALDEASVAKVGAEVEALGFTKWSLDAIVETIRMNVILVGAAVTFIALVALTVSALGIANTMAMSVLERTHEIGVLKAIGAREGQIRALFLVEGAAAGFVGGVFGLGLAWALSIPAGSFAKTLMEAQAPRPVEGPLFVFPIALVLGAPALATVIATMAAAYPAHRAARVDPVEALRHD